MQIIILLKEVLRPHLGWHGTRLVFAATFPIALFRVKSINLSELAVGFGGKALTRKNELVPELLRLEFCLS